MGKSIVALAWLGTVLLGLGVRPADAYIANQRWDRTATNPSTGSMGTPITLTWSLPADGTLIPGNTVGTNTANNLQSFLDTHWNVVDGGSDLTQRSWFPIFEQSFTRLGALSGLTFVYEPSDDGVGFTNFNSGRGVLGVRGDLRIGGKSYGSGSNTLASNYFPDYGEMMINTDQAGFLSTPTNSFRRFPRHAHARGDARLGDQPCRIKHCKFPDRADYQCIVRRSAIGRRVGHSATVWRLLRKEWWQRCFHRRNAAGRGQPIAIIGEGNIWQLDRNHCQPGRFPQHRRRLRHRLFQLLA